MRHTNFGKRTLSGVLFRFEMREIVYMFGFWFLGNQGGSRKAL